MVRSLFPSLQFLPLHSFSDRLLKSPRMAVFPICFFRSESPLQRSKFDGPACGIPAPITPTRRHNVRGEHPLEGAAPETGETSW